jgi:hypothetical protein
VEQPIAGGTDHGSPFQAIVPVLDRELAGEDAGAGSVAVLEDHEQIAAVLVTQRCKPHSSIPCASMRARRAGGLKDLAARELPIGSLVIIDGGKGVRSAVIACWPKVAMRRCGVHKLRDLEVHAPKRRHDEPHQDYSETVCAADPSDR